MSLGLPPNALILFLIHFKAVIWSYKPKLPSIGFSFKEGSITVNPKGPKR